jgi:hypothetical protein
MNSSIDLSESICFPQRPYAYIEPSFCCVNMEIHSRRNESEEQLVHKMRWSDIPYGICKKSCLSDQTSLLCMILRYRITRHDKNFF